MKNLDFVKLSPSNKPQKIQANKRRGWPEIPPVGRGPFLWDITTNKMPQAHVTITER